MDERSAISLPKEGDVIDGKYAVVRVIGEGGMGIVYEAIHRRLEQRVAIKMLLPDVLALSDIVERFEREARAAARLRSRHVARVIDVGETSEKLPYMVMELLEGHDLQEEITARPKLPLTEAVDYLVQACVGMAEAHDAGIVHRDLKPSNLFLAREGGETIVKVLDFGISKVATGSSRATSTESTLGTPLYMSPEQIRSTKNVDARADVWSLGIILYELLAGSAPYEGAAASVGAAIVADPLPPLQAHRRDVPEELVAVLEKALTKDREGRYRSARELALALMPFAGRPVSVAALAVEPRSESRPRMPSVEESAETLAIPTGEPRPATVPGWTRADETLPRQKRGVAIGAAVLSFVVLAGFVAIRARSRADGSNVGTGSGIPLTPDMPARGEPSQVPGIPANGVRSTAENLLPPAESVVPSTPPGAPSTSAHAPSATQTAKPAGKKLPPSKPTSHETKPIANPSRL